MGNLLEVNNVSKIFGSKVVLSDISFTLEEGRVLGILSPNAQGKTTLLNIISGLYKSTSGNISLQGIVASSEIKNYISFLQEKDFLLKWMRVKDAIKFYKDFFKDFDENKCIELLDFMKVDKRSGLKTLSKGQLEKLGVSLTLSRKSKLYILDEPISGVDTISRGKIIDAIISNLDENSSMIITTHYIGELEKLFDDVIFLREGKIIEKGQAEDLRMNYSNSIEEIYKSLYAE